MSYKISVGLERPAETIAGYLEPGNHIIKGQARPVAIRVGVYGIPNYTAAWGMRVVNGKPKIVKTDDGEVEMSYEVDDALYKGEIKFLEWGDPIGQSIDCRWIRNVGSIDRMYQDLVLKVTIREQDPAAFLIEVKQGDNIFNDVSDKALIQFLKVHYYNEQSKSKSPHSQTMLSYKEVSEADIRKKKTRSIDNKVEGIVLVNSASEGMDANQKIKNLLAIVDGIEFQGIDKKDVPSVYEALKVFADANPDLFAARVQQHKKLISAALSKAETYERLDLTRDGTIAWMDKGKAKPLIENIPAKGNVMKDWCFQNFLEPSVFDGLDKLKKLVDKL